MVRLTLFLALVVVPAVASDSATVGDVTFGCKITGSDYGGFTLFAENRGTTDKKCKATCALTTRGGGTEEKTSELLTVRAGNGKTLVTMELEGEKPLSNPQVKNASCE